MLNIKAIRLIASFFLTLSFLGTAACSKDSDSGKDQAKGSIVQKPGKGPNGGDSVSGPAPTPVVEMPVEGGGQPGSPDDVAVTPTLPHPIDGPDSGDGNSGGAVLVPPANPDENTGNNGTTQPAEPGGSNTGDNTNAGTGTSEPTTPAEPGTDPGEPGDGQMTEEQIYEILTKAFAEYLPLGTYKGDAENGQSCTVTVKPFSQPGKDLTVTIETSGGTHGAGNDKLTVTLAPNQNATIVGVPKEDPPLLRMWIELAIPSFGMMGPKQSIQLLSVKFDPQTKKAQKIYIFDQTREGLGNTSINCAVSL